MRHEKVKGGRGHVCSFERKHEVISFANFFPLPCTRMSGIMNYRVCLLDTFRLPCFILLYIPSSNIFPELVEFLIRCIIDASILLPLFIVQIYDLFP